MSDYAKNLGLTPIAPPVEPRGTRYSKNQAPQSSKRPLFSYTINSKDTYHSATVAGRRKLDNQSQNSLTRQLPATVPTNVGIHVSYASIATVDNSSIMQPDSKTTVTAITTDTSLISTAPPVVSQEIVDQITQTLRLEFAGQLTAIHQEATEAKSLATDVSTRLSEKQTEVLGTITMLN